MTKPTEEQFAIYKSTALYKTNPIFMSVVDQLKEMTDMSSMWTEQHGTPKKEKVSFIESLQEIVDELYKGRPAHTTLRFTKRQFEQALGLDKTKTI